MEAHDRKDRAPTAERLLRPRLKMTYGNSATGGPPGAEAWFCMRAGALFSPPPVRSSPNVHAPGLFCGAAHEITIIATPFDLHS